MAMNNGKVLMNKPREVPDIMEYVIQWKDKYKQAVYCLCIDID